MWYPLSANWNWLIIILSYLTSVLGSWTALQVLYQVQKTRSFRFKQLWLVFASISLGGCAIWGMHFVGMLAMEMKVKISYTPSYTALSFIIPIIAGRLAFHILNLHRINHFGVDHVALDNLQPVRLDDHHEDPTSTHVDDDHGTQSQVEWSIRDASSVKGLGPGGFHWGSRRRRNTFDGSSLTARETGAFRVFKLGSTGRFTVIIASLPRLISSGFCLAVAICGMHYMGMVAMGLEACNDTQIVNFRQQYSPGIIVLSFAIAWVVATIALILSGNLRVMWKQLCAALIMGLGVCAMHYTGMQSASYYVDLPEDQLLTFGSGGEACNAESERLAFIVVVFLMLTCFTLAGLVSTATASSRDRLEQTMLINKQFERLIHDKESAERANRTKTAFVTTMSHEIRTPLAAILAYTDILSRTPLRPDQASHLLTITRSSRILQGFLDNVLDLSKIEAGRILIQEQAFSPRRLLEEVVDMTGSLVADPVDYLLHIHPDVPALVLGDQERFREILLNLLGNALKFTPRGVVRASLRPGDDGAIPGDSARSSLLLEITDSGIGIAPDAQEIIFRPFTQANEGIAQRYGGTGLGLMVSRELVELMHGRITLDSQLGSGSTFLVDIPFGVVPREMQDDGGVGLHGEGADADGEFDDEGGGHADNSSNALVPSKRLQGKTCGLWLRNPQTTTLLRQHLTTLEIHTIDLAVGSPDSPHPRNPADPLPPCDIYILDVEVCPDYHPGKALEVIPDCFWQATHDQSQPPRLLLLASLSYPYTGVLPEGVCDIWRRPLQIHRLPQSISRALSRSIPSSSLRKRPSLDSGSLSSTYHIPSHDTVHETVEYTPPAHPVRPHLSASTSLRQRGTSTSSAHVLRSPLSSHSLRHSRPPPPLTRTTSEDRFLSALLDYTSRSDIHGISEAHTRALPLSVASPPPIPPNSRGTILYAEDNAINWKIGELLLQRLGFAVDIAKDGQEAYGKFVSSPPGHYSLILMDCQMPIMDGFRASALIREREAEVARIDPSSPTAPFRIPIIALTASTSGTWSDRSRDAGMDDYLVKPLGLSDLQTTLARLTLTPPPDASAPYIDSEGDVDSIAVLTTHSGSLPR